MSAIEVLWLPSELTARPSTGGPICVVDLIRATTSISTALAAGATRVYTARTVESARSRASEIDEALLCGERGGLPPEGFDLGNSPREFTAEVVRGRPLVFTTSNGTAAIDAALDVDPSPSALVLGCFRNLSATARILTVASGQSGSSIAIVCAGRRGGVSMDDAWCAGHLVRTLVANHGAFELNDGARSALALAAHLGEPTAEGLAKTEAGALGEIGLEADLAVCATQDDLRVVPTWRDGAFVTGGEEDS